MLTVASPKSRSIVFGIIATAAVAIASGLGQLATFPKLGWYGGLAKPAFNPPNWVFGPVWTTLYALMAFAAWRIMRLPNSGQRSLALLLFFGQLVLNAAWSWMFFGFNSPLLGLINIIPQLALIVLATIVFYRLDRMAGWLLIPLAVWVAFATILNAAVWRLNA
jgi:tryptophan-rich sensory protein